MPITSNLISFMTKGHITINIYNYVFKNSKYSQLTTLNYKEKLIYVNEANNLLLKPEN